MKFENYFTREKRSDDRSSGDDLAFEVLAVVAEISKGKVATTGRSRGTVYSHLQACGIISEFSKRAYNIWGQ